MHHLSPRDEDRLDDLIDRVEGDLSRRNVLRRSSLRTMGERARRALLHLSLLSQRFLVAFTIYIMISSDEKQPLAWRACDLY